MRNISTRLVPVLALGVIFMCAAGLTFEMPEDVDSPANRYPEEEKTFEDGDVKEHESKEVQVSSPPFTEGIFPCSNCHGEMEPNTERRELMMHTDIVFEHDEENRWCLDCHDAENRDLLHSAGGKPIEFSESYKLCGQCHGPRLRDWKAGVHGKRTGYWRGSKRYLLCVHCHDPHSPEYKPIEPMKAPVRPGDKRP